MNSKIENGVMVSMSAKKSHLQQPQFELLTRILSAAILIPFFLWVTYKGGAIFHSVLVLVFITALREWSRLSTNSIFHPLCAAALIGVISYNTTLFTPYIQIASALALIGTTYYQHKTLVLPSLNRWMLFIGGLFYITTSMLCFFYISQHNSNSPAFLLWLYGIVWATDSGAYLIGKTLKGPKLCPKISPNKTWSGFIGGIVSAIIGGLYLLKILELPLTSFVPNTLLILIISCSAHFGDLIESSAKRHFGVKNAGGLIPGHGGVLDRLDSLFLVVIVTGLLLFFNIIQF